MKKLLFICVGFVALMLTSCQNKDDDFQSSVNKGFSLSYSVPNSELNGPTTRANVDATAEENAINSFYILFFERNDQGEGKFLEVYDASPASGQTLSPTGVLNINFPAGSALNLATAYNMLMVVNVNRYLNGQDVASWLQSFAGKSQNQVMAEYTLTTNTTDPIVSSDIFMSAKGVKEQGKSKVVVELERGVVRVDVQNNADTDIYNLRSASIWNVYPSTYIWNSNAPKNYGLNRSKMYGEVTGITSNKVVAGLYAFENNVASPKKDDYVTTCLILGIQKGGSTTYYRVNINLNSIGQSLVRNNVYKLSIQNVKGDGAANPQEAYESGELLLDISVNGWIEAQEGNVKYDGDNLFAVPTTKIVFTPTAETRYFSIFTSGVGNLTMSQKVLPTGLTATLNPATKELTVSAAASSDKRDGWIELAFAGMRTIIYISQTGDLDEYLDLSTYSIPSFPAAADYPMQINSIAVSSSGPWTATIFDDVFTFGFQASILKKSGVSGDTFNVATYKPNAANTIKYSFVLISLDSNPDINRVVILSQKGVGGISLSPAIDQLIFNANGQEINSSGVVMNTPTEITPSAGNDASNWTATLSGSYASKFILSSTTGATSSTGVTGLALWVTASKNVESTEITSTMRVRLTTAPTVFKDIQIKQLCHTLSLQSAAIPTISSSGGATTDITVTSSDAWVASITTENCVATLNKTSGVSGEKFKVTFGANNSPGTTPKATVVVSINGVPAVSKTIVINQTALDPRKLVIQSSRNYYGNMTMSGYNGYFNSWNANIRNTSYFGNSSSAKVYTGGVFTFNNNETPQSNAGIFNITQGTNATYNSAINTWYNSDTRNFLMVVSDIEFTTTTTTMQTVTGQSFTTTADSGGGPRVAASRSASNVKNQKVWDYIFVNGPFGKVNGTISLTSDGYVGNLTNYPASTVPILIRSGSNTVHVAIDPVYRLLYISDCDLFSTFGNNNQFTEGSDNWIMMNNIIAFMVNSAQYGDSFLDSFR